MVNHFHVNALKNTPVSLSLSSVFALERERQDGTLARRGCCHNPSSTKAAGTLQLEEAFGATKGIKASVPSWGYCGWPGSCWDVQRLCTWNEPTVNMKGTCRPTDLRAMRRDNL